MSALTLYEEPTAQADQADIQKALEVRHLMSTVLGLVINSGGRSIEIDETTITPSIVSDKQGNYSYKLKITNPDKSIISISQQFGPRHDSSIPAITMFATELEVSPGNKLTNVALTDSAQTGHPQEVSYGKESYLRSYYTPNLSSMDVYALLLKRTREVISPFLPTI